MKKGQWIAAILFTMMLMAVCAKAEADTTWNMYWPVPASTSIAGKMPSDNGRPHRGIDIGSSKYTAIVAAADGVVHHVSTHVSPAKNGGGDSDSICKVCNDNSLGNHVCIQCTSPDPDGETYYMFYMHMSYVTVAAGETIQKGEVIGFVGSTGYSSGNHLHFEIETSGNSTNPIDVHTAMNPLLVNQRLSGYSANAYFAKYDKSGVPIIEERACSLLPGYTYRANQCLTSNRVRVSGSETVESDIVVSLYYPTQQKKGTGFWVRGYVSTANGKPITKVTVSVEDESGNVLNNVTNSSGTINTYGYDLFALDSGIVMGNVNTSGICYYTVRVEYGTESILFRKPFVLTTDSSAEKFARLTKRDAGTEAVATGDAALRAKMNTIYSQAVAEYGSSFNGWCGDCVGMQLKCLGISSTKLAFDGNKYYDSVPATTSGGYSTYKFPGTNKGGTHTVSSVVNALDAVNDDGHFQYVALCFKTGNTVDAGMKYGHVLLLYGVYNGNVYYTESYGTTVNVKSIDSFCSIYGPKENGYFQFDGAVWFSKTSVPALEPETPIGNTYISFTDIPYPKIFEIDTSMGYFVKSGTITSDNATITSVKMDIYHAKTGASVSGMPYQKSVSTKNFSVASWDPYIQYTSITQPGAYVFRIDVSCADGKSAAFQMPFEAFAKGNASTTTQTVSTTPCTQTPTSVVCAHGVYDMDRAETIEPPNCTELGVRQVPCVACEWDVKLMPFTQLDPDNHDIVTDEAVTATCTMPGHTEGSHCARCEKIIVQQEEIPATGHTEIANIPYPATDTEDGLFGGTYCSVCNAMLEAGRIVAQSNRLILPEKTRNIGEEAFAGIAVEQIEIPSGVVSISSRAFADCTRLIFVIIPDSVQYIAVDAFENCSDAVIVCNTGSYAQWFANAHNIPILLR